MINFSGEVNVDENALLFWNLSWLEVGCLVVVVEVLLVLLFLNCRTEEEAELLFWLLL